MALITSRKAENGTEFYLGNLLIGTALSAEGAVDHIVPMGEGLFRWNRKTEKPAASLTMRFEAAYELRYQMLPACSYDGNRDPEIMDYSKIRRIANNESDEGADNQYFKDFRDEKTGKPWVLSFWNMSIPGAAYSEGEKVSAATFLPPDQQDAAASCYPEGDKTVHEMIWPSQMGPRVPHLPTHENTPLMEVAGMPGVIRTGKTPPWQDGYSDSIVPRTDFAVMLDFAPVTEPKTAWHKLIDDSWMLYYKIVPPKFSDEEVWDMGLTFARSLYDEDEDGFKGFSFGKMWAYGKWTNRIMYRFALGWCGQSALNATNLLVSALLTGDKRDEEMGFSCLDSWISRTRPNGLLPTDLEEQEYTDKGRRIFDACNLGCGALQYFYASRLAPMFGKERPGYYKAASDICDFALRVMSPEGKIGKSWHDDDMSPYIEDGTTGAFLTVALAEGVRYTGRADYLEGAKRSFRFYYDEFMAKGYSMGGAQDIFTIDKESAIPLLKAALALYDLTNDENYIDCAENAAYYLATWQWCYTRKLNPGSTVAKLQYDSFGGTSVSIHGAGNDPYALDYVHELYDLSEITGNEQWAQRAHAAWVNGMDGISDGTMVADGRPVPRGGQHEARGLGDGFEREYQWLVAWPTAFRLENLRRTLAPFEDRIGRKL